MLLCHKSFQRALVLPAGFMLAACGVSALDSRRARRCVDPLADQLHGMALQHYGVGQADPAGPGQMTRVASTAIVRRSSQDLGPVSPMSMPREL